MLTADLRSLKFLRFRNQGHTHTAKTCQESLAGTNVLLYSQSPEEDAHVLESFQRIGNRFPRNLNLLRYKFRRYLN